MPRAAAIAVAALAAGAAVVAIELASNHRDARVVWAVFAPAVIWSFVGTGLYAWRARPASRVGLLMVLLGFAWVLFTLDAANAAWLYTIGLVTGGLWGGVFLHLGLGFPTGRLLTRLDRSLAIAGYIIFPLAFVPALLFAGPAELNCPDCPTNVLLIRPDEDLAAILTGVGALAYATLFVVVLGARCSAGGAPAPSSGCSWAPCTCARSGRSCSSRWPAPAAATSPSGPRSSPLR